VVAEGFALTAGPLEGEREVLWIVEAKSENAIRLRMAEDPWAAVGMLSPASIERWTVVLDGRRLGNSQLFGEVSCRGH